MADEPENLTLKLLREMRAEQERSATHAAVVYKLRFSFVHIGAPQTSIGAENHNQFNAFNMSSDGHLRRRLRCAQCVM